MLSADDLEYVPLAARYGPRLVVQGPRGNAGQRTWLVASEAEIEAVKPREHGKQVRVAELIDGMPFTVNAVTDEEGLLDWTGPCRQVTGVPWLTPMPLGSCGNAWGERPWSRTCDARSRVAAAIGSALSHAGFSGVFGVDFVLGADGPVVIETNPRMVASLPLATQLEVEAGRVPLLLAHLLGLVGDPHEAPGGSGAGRPAGRRCRRRLPGDRPSASEGDPASGPSCLRRLPPAAGGGAPVFLRAGAWLSDVLSDDEALLLVREPKEPVTPAKEFARVYLRGSTAELTPGLTELVSTPRGPDRRKLHRGQTCWWQGPSRRRGA